MGAQDLLEHYAVILQIARRAARTLHEAGEVVQGVGLRVLAGRVHSEDAAGPVLSGVVRNVAREARRREQRAVDRDRRASPGTAPADPLELLTRLELHRALLGAIDRLQEPYRAAVLMRYVEGLSAHAIADNEARSVETVKSRIQRGRAQLRSRLGDQLPVLVAPVGAGMTGWTTASGLGNGVLKGGAFMAQWHSRKWIVAIVVLLLGALAAWQLAGVDWGRDTPTDTGSRLLDGASLAGGAKDEPNATLAGAPGTANVVPETAPATDQAPSADSAVEPATVEPETSALRTRPRVQAPSVRRSLFREHTNRGTPRIGPSGGSGGPRILPFWSKYGPEPIPKGSCVLEVRMVDQNGVPVPGGDVFLSPPGLDAVDVLSFGDVRKLGQTDADGVLRREDLTAGTVSVLGNAYGALTRDARKGKGGLDGSTRVSTVLREGAARKTELRVPIDVSRLGTLAGTVRNADGEPLQGARVQVGMQWPWTKRDGSWEVKGVPAGPITIQIGRFGWESSVAKVTVEAGTTTRHDVALKRKTSVSEGSTVVSGTVEGPEGKPIEGAHVYLSIKGEMYGGFTHYSDKEGRFEFRDLPDRVSSKHVNLMASRMPHYGGAYIEYPKGVPSGSINLRMTQRYVDIRIAVLDRDTGERISRVVAQVLEGPVDKTRGPGAAMGAYGEDRVLKGRLQYGRYKFKIEALNHKDLEVDLDIPNADTFEHEVKMVRDEHESLDVHLTVTLIDATTREPITGRAELEIRDQAATVLSAYRGGDRGGAYLFSAYSGARVLRVVVEGYETYSQPLLVEDDKLEQATEIALRPNP
ncbi:MAG: sigma-70 family RNA polymerase sigma factor [bacterium]|nr:sigma-70 family RNA polymerase sigma factor [bacterium]